LIYAGTKICRKSHFPKYTFVTQKIGILTFIQLVNESGLVGFCRLVEKPFFPWKKNWGGKIVFATKKQFLSY